MPPIYEEPIYEEPSRVPKLVKEEYPPHQGLLERLKDRVFGNTCLVLILAFIGVSILAYLLGVVVGRVGIVLHDLGDLPNQPIKQTALSYFTTIKNDYSGATFGEPKIANLERLTVSDADRANGITEKATITLTFIYRESSTTDWKDAQWNLWLEKKNDWKVVDARKVLTPQK